MSCVTDILGGSTPKHIMLPEAPSREATFVELFAGGGMARLGLGPHWRCVLANDIDPKKAGAYVANFGADHFVLGDVANITGAFAEPVNLLWASSPCTDLSLAGARAGLAGARSGTAWHVIRILSEMRPAPALCVFENVAGLKTSNNGRDLAALTRALTDEGYTVTLYEIDAALFVPQSRPRVFVVAARLAPELWPAMVTPAHRNTVLADILEPGAAWDSAEKTGAILGSMTPTNLAKLPLNGVGALYRRTRNGVPVYEARFDGLAGCLRTAAGGSSVQKILAVENGVARSRRLTAREAARLMGLADDYRLPESFGAAYSLCGDGVVVPVVRHLDETILTPLLRRINNEE